MTGRLPQTIITAIVSPRARLIAKTRVAMIPAILLRRTINLIFCQEVEPRARLDSRMLTGTLANSSVKRLVISGMTITPRTMPPAKTV